MLAPFVLRRLKAGVLKQLVAKTERLEKVPLSKVLFGVCLHEERCCYWDRLEVFIDGHLLTCSAFLLTSRRESCSSPPRGAGFVHQEKAAEKTDQQKAQNLPGWRLGQCQISFILRQMT